MLQYTNEFPQDAELAFEILENYSGIPREEVKDHIIRIHDEASEHPDPYPCIINYHFLRFHISQHPIYHDILAQLSAPNSSKKFLDLGTCFGQDLRVMAHHGAPTESLYAADLYQEFIELGFDLFQDRDRLGQNIISGDIFAETSALDKFVGKMDYISATAFIHLFSKQDQIKVCEKMVSFLKPFSAGQEHRQVIFGRQTGTINPGVRVRDQVDWGKKELFLHDEKTFEELWNEVGMRTGTSWKVKTEMRPWQRDGVKGIEAGEAVRLLVFSIERVK